MARLSKITGRVEVMVCDLHARGLNPSRITKELANQGVKITQQGVWYWLNDPLHTHKLQKAIDKYRSDPLAVPLAHKRIRLEDLNRERLDLIHTLQEYKSKDGIVLDKKFYKYLNGLKRLIEIEKEGREEIEHRPDMVAFFQRTGPYGEVGNDELRKIEGEIKEQLLIIGRRKIEDRASNSSENTPSSGS